MSHSEFASVTWVLEAGVFPDSHDAMAAAVRGLGHVLRVWDEDWAREDRWPRWDDRPVVFQGSLGVADLVARRLPWRPGSFCDTAAFCCSSWYPRARRWLLQQDWVVAAADELVAAPERVLSPLGEPDALFVRPDSPLKPFSGRVLRRDAITLRALDHGFYYDDASLPVVVAPVRRVGREWRYVVVGREVIAGSAYDAERRASREDSPEGAPWRFAAEVARELDAPAEVYVLDVCEADGALHLLELNPFGGADLYACDRGKIVDAVSRWAIALRVESEPG